MTRLDKITAKQLNISRTQAKAMIKNGEVCVNGTVIKSVDFKCSDDDKISAGGKEIERRHYDEQAKGRYLGERGQGRQNRN